MAPIPGETKVWQYITLMKRIYLIDCPGVVPPNTNATPEDILLRGVVRVENVEHPEQYIAAVLRKTKKHHIEKTYDVKGFETPTEFLELLARKGGRLLRGGEADVDGVAKMVLNDFLRGKIPWFTAPPVAEGTQAEGIEGRKGALGEMGKVEIPLKETSREKGTNRKPERAGNEVEMASDDESGEFEGFDDDDAVSDEDEDEDEDVEEDDENQDELMSDDAGPASEVNIGLDRGGVTLHPT